MAELAPLSEAQRREIVRQIGALLPASPLGGPPGSGGAPKLGASYPIDLLPLAPVEAGVALREAVQDTGRWHHQIEATKPSFARSAAEPGAGHKVNALGESDLARAIERAAVWIDSVDSARDEAHLLIAPAYNLTCIRLIGSASDRIVAVERPNRLARLEAEHFYGDAEFMEILRAVPPISGVPPRDE